MEDASGNGIDAAPGPPDPLPPLVKSVLSRIRVHHKSSRRPLKNGCLTAFRRLGPLLDLSEQLGLDPNAAVGDALAVRLGFADERCQARA